MESPSAITDIAIIIVIIKDIELMMFSFIMKLSAIAEI